MSSLLDDTEILELPALDVVNVAASAKSMELKARRMQVLGQLARPGEKNIILVSAQAAMQKDMSRQDFENSSIQLEITKEYNYGKLLEEIGIARLRTHGQSGATRSVQRARRHCRRLSHQSGTAAAHRVFSTMKWNPSANLI